MILEKFLSQKRADLVNKLIPFDYRKGIILDIGCGERLYFLNNTDFSLKYGIDRITANKHEKIAIANCDIEKDGLKVFNDEFFDVVTMLAVFEHISLDKLDFVVKEIRRVLKPNGIVILTTPASWTGWILEILAKLKILNPAMIEEHQKLYKKKDIVNVFTKAGFLEGNIRLGSFEAFMNTWAVAVNTKQGNLKT